MEQGGGDLWPTTQDAARAVQDRLRGRVVRHDDFGPVRRIAALDAHHSEAHGLTWAAVAEVTPDTLELVRSVLLARPTRFPYVPGLLSFREAPAIMEAIALLPEPPDLLLVDGQGIAHPRRLGIASHIGVLTGLPAIGVGKSRLCGRYDEPEAERGSWTPLIHRKEQIGAVLRTRTGVSPLFISTGHRVGLLSCIELVLRFTPRWRLPEPIRLADALSRMHPR